MTPHCALPSELVFRLIKQGLEKGYLSNVVRTVDGQCLLSKSHLDYTITKTVQAQQRITITSLADGCSVDQSTVSEAANNLALQHDWTILNDIVMTRQYIDSIQDQVKDDIEQNGYLSMFAKAEQVKLTYEVMQKIIQPVLDNYECHKRVPYLICTKEFSVREQNRVVDVLQQASEPVPMHTLQHQIPADMFEEIVDCVKKCDLPGTFHGVRGHLVFEPHVYRDRQLSLICSLVEANDYIEYGTIKGHYAFEEPKSLIRKKYPDIVLFDNGALMHGRIVDVQQKMEDALANDGWVDVSEHLPVSFPSKGYEQLLDHVLPLVQKTKHHRDKCTCSVVEPSFVVTSHYIQERIDNAQEFLDEYALQHKQLEKNLHGRTKKQNHTTTVELSDSETIDHLVNDQQVDAHLASNMVKLLRKPLSKVLSKSMQSVYLPKPLRDLDAWVQARIKDQHDLACDLKSKIYFTYMAVSQFKDDTARKSLQKYIMRHLCVDFVFHFALATTLSGHHVHDKASALSLTNLDQGDMENTNRIVLDKRKSVILHLSQYDDTLQHLVHMTLNEKKLDPWILYITESLPTEYKKPLDKSETCQTVQKSLASTLENSLVTESSAASILHVTSLLCFQALYKLPLYVSGKFVPAILHQIAGELPDNEAELLKNAQTMVLTSAKEKSVSLDSSLFVRVRQLGLDKASQM